jgi:hypothetical protein
VGQCLPLPSAPLLYDGGSMAGTTGSAATLSPTSQELSFRHLDVQCCYVQYVIILKIYRHPWQNLLEFSIPSWIQPSSFSLRWISQLTHSLKELSLLWHYNSAFRMILTIKSDYFPELYWPVSLCNGDAVSVRSYQEGCRNETLYACIVGALGLNPMFFRGFRLSP